MDDIKKIHKETEEEMKKAITALQREFATLRTGVASVTILDNIFVECYGSTCPLKQIASLNAPEPRLLVIQPYDRSLIGSVEKAILKSDLGLNPASDGTFIRIPIPRLTEERRKELSKLVSKLTEESKVSVRRSRGEANKHLEALEKDKKISEDDEKRGQEEIQKLTDKYIELLDKVAGEKTKEIMKV